MAKVGIIMGSKSDLPIMQEAIDILNEFGIENHAEIVSAHRTPEKMMEYGKNAHNKGFSVIIAGAGGAAHLPGMIASITPVPEVKKSQSHSCAALPIPSKVSCSFLQLSSLSGCTVQCSLMKLNSPLPSSASTQVL